MQKAAALGVTALDSPLDVAAEADIVSLHVSSNAETKGLAGTAFFEAMKQGAFLINTTRGAVVDEDAMLNAIADKNIRVGLDVFSNEPAFKSGDFKHSLADNPNVYLTHHIGASTAQAQEAIAEEAGRVIVEYSRTGDVPNCVNLATKTGCNASDNDSASRQGRCACKGAQRNQRGFLEYPGDGKCRI